MQVLVSDKRSTSNYFNFFYENIVVWMIQKQNIVTQSSCNEIYIYDKRNFWTIVNETNPRRFKNVKTLKNSFVMTIRPLIPIIILFNISGQKSLRFIKLDILTNSLST